MKKIATAHTPFKEKFGIPRQSGLVDCVGKIVFDKKYSRVEAFRGIEGFSHLWILWEFSENVGKPWCPTVRPPRLGGNSRIGVFATRSPFRPNPIGISCVKLLNVDKENGRIILTVSGVDMLDGTPVYDVKPYVSYTDSIPDAVGGFSDKVKDYSLSVIFSDDVFCGIDDDIKSKIIDILKEDPRPSYQDHADRIYGMNYSGFEIKFSVSDSILNVISVKPNHD